MFDKYSKLSEKEKKMFHITIVVVVIWLFDLVIFRPYLSKMKTYNDEIVQNKNSIKRDMRFLSYEDKIYQEKKYYSEYTIVEDADEGELKTDFLRSVEQIASESEIDILKINAEQPVDKTGHILYFVNLECSGRFEDIVKFMYQIDSTKDLLKIIKFSMTRNKAKVDTVSASFKISKLINSLTEVQVAGTLGNKNTKDALPSDYSQERLKEGLYLETQDSSSQQEVSGNLESTAAQQQNIKGKHILQGQIQGESHSSEKQAGASENNFSKSISPAGKIQATPDDVAPEKNGDASNLPGGSQQTGEVNQPNPSALPGKQGGADSDSGSSQNQSLNNNNSKDNLNGGGQLRSSGKESIKAQGPKEKSKADELNKGVRVELPTLQSLWNNFWGEKNNTSEVPDKKDQDAIPIDEKQQESDDRSLWERKVNKMFK